MFPRRRSRPGNASEAAERAAARAALPSRIFLIGPMGAGKSTLGRRLANLAGLRFVDSDHEIERQTGVDIPYIFEKEGEAGFRERERRIISELSEQEGIVMATGGGAVLNADTRAELSARGLVIYLHAGVDQQLRRTARGAHRPLLKTGDRRQTLTTLFAQRDPLYREIANLIVDTDGRNTRRLAQQIYEQLMNPMAQS
jgi:shikimate kinase